MRRSARSAPVPVGASARAFAIETCEPRLLLAAFTVTNTANNGAGSLRQAIIDANALPGHDTIVFDASFSTPRTIVLTTPTQQIGDALTITGPGASLLTIRRSLDGPAVSRRVLDSFAPVLNVSGMTLTGGTVDANGGGLSAAGISPNVTLDGVVITGNTATGDGGGVFLNNNATLTLRNSTVSGNSSRNGGGVFFFDNGSLVMENSTVSGNASTGIFTGGGGIYFYGAARPTPPAGFTPNTLVIRDSTISNNTSTRGGGGIVVGDFVGTLALQNSTVSGNTAAGSGGGVLLTGANGTGSVSAVNSTITNNTANGTAAGAGGGGVARDATRPGAVTLANTVVSGNANANAPDVFANAFTTTVANSSAIGSARGFTLSAGSGDNLPYNVNPMLGPLADNGGPTRTHALLPGSPLIDAGSTARVPPGMSFDQRGPGYPRVLGRAVDIGAFEAAAALSLLHVTQVFVSSPQLTAATTNANTLAFRSQAGVDPAFGYAVPAGANQLKWIPWTGGINAVALRFSNDVSSLLQQGDLAIRGITAATYVPTTFNYDPGTRTGVWTFPTVTNDKLRFYLDDALVSGLDGEWVNGADAYPSGNGTAGGDFDFRVNVLGGDATQDGRVNAVDLSFVKQRQNRSSTNPGTTGALYSPFADVDANGTINALDLSAVKARQNRNTPTGEPLATSLLFSDKAISP